MKKIILATAIATMMSTAAFAQFNQNAPQPSSDGRGVNVPATSSTGAAIDQPDSNRMEQRDRAVRNNSGSSMSNDGATTGMSGGRTDSGMSGSDMSGSGMSGSGTSNSGMSR